MGSVKTQTCDVVIIGTGISGTTLGAILARHGVNVIMVDSASHPRFAIGESTIATTTQTLEFLNLRYDVPELLNLTSVGAVHENVQASSGVKRNFGFIYHRPESRQDPEQVNQALVVNEVHYFRQDIDAYMLQVAIRYGCKVHQNTPIEAVRISDTGVEVDTKSGSTIAGQYLVDAAGFRSPLASALDLREAPTRLKTHARGLFTHMIDVTPYDECFEGGDAERPPVPWHQGTLHHLFDGGWMWVIPFNNVPESRNQLVSVGLMMDPRQSPKPEGDPGDEFNSFLRKYPSIGKQFVDAKPVREWVSSHRIQYSSRRVIGDRYCLLSHSAGFIDPLFSRGLYNTMQTINVLAAPLLEALKQGDFSSERFAHVELMQQGLMDYNDQLVHSSYVSFRNYELWNAWFRLWLLTGSYSQLRLQRAILKYNSTKDPAYLAALDGALPGAYTAQPSLAQLFLNSAQCLSDVEAGKLSAGDATSEIYRQLEQHREWVNPFFDFLDPRARMTLPHPPEKIQGIVKEWLAGMPASIRNEYFDYPIESLFARPVVKDAAVPGETS